MSEPTPQPTPNSSPTPTAPPQPPQEGAQQPPWGSPEQFDPDKAWKLIEDLRADKAKLSSRAMSDEQRQQLAEFEKVRDAQKSEAQRQQEAVEAANRERETAASEALRYRVAIENGVSKEDLDLLGTGTQEQLEARAKRISEIRAAGAPQTPPAIPQRPSEQLQPGASPAGEKNEDDQLYESLFGAPK